MFRVSIGWIPSVALILVLTLLAGCGSSSSSSSPTATPSGGSGGASLGLISPGTLTVGSDVSYPPMEYHDPAHPSVAVGADVDIAQALAKQMGLSGAKVVNGVFDTLITSLQAKRYDIVMSSMSDTPERAKKIDFVDYMTGTEGILVPTSSAIKGNTYAALCGKSVAVEKGTTELFGLQAADKSCSSKMNILSFPDDVGAYNAFAAGHADSYTSDLPVVLNYINKYKGKYRQAGKAIFSGGNYGIALRKGDTALKKAIQSALSKIRSNGTYTKILKKWGVADAALKA